MIDFDTILQRKGTNCHKWDSLVSEYGKDNDIIPMGIADMDFPCSDEILAALRKKIDERAFGYCEDPLDGLRELIVERYNARDYNITADDIVIATGVVYAINNVIRAFSKPGDKIVLPVPYYTPFRPLVEKNGCQVLECPMVIRNGRYEMDLAAIEDAVDERTTMFIFCNPHNPTGRIFDEDELREVADFCQRHALWIINDEIHADFTLNKPMRSILNISEYTRSHTFTFLSATKTFNLAGMKMSFGFITDPQCRDRYHQQAGLTGLESINSLAPEAVKAAYRSSALWEKGLIDYLRANCAYACQFIKERLPQITVYPNEGTYLLWLDMRNCGIEAEKLNEYLINEAHVQLNDGVYYGRQFAGYQRMNCALPLSQLREALERMEKALNR
ncbi:MAG: PatB family C-S lyase [Erysipelotrichaceae bacterium]|nr:PatB family C-S lyase [Erysipelotrichaceae bacterium]